VSVPLLPAAEYGRHLLAPHPAARESLSYMLQLPEHDLGGFVYTWVNAESIAGSALCLYGPAVGAEPLFLHVDGIEVPADMPFSDWSVGDLRLHHGEHVTTGVYSGGGASIDFTFTPTNPAYNYASHPDGALPWMATDRFEQSGRWEGSLTLQGRTIDFDVISHRDQSWGIRDWGMCQHYRWLQANAGPDWSVNFTQDSVLGHVSTRGYVWRDGEMGQIVSLACDYELGSDMIHRTLDAEIVDDLGRTTTLTGTTYATMEFPFPPTTKLIVCSDRIAIEGHEGRGQFDLLWAWDYIEHVRARGLPELPPRKV
jgi:hypothetical protein